MTDPVARFRGSKSVGRYHVWKLFKKFLHLLRSGKEGYRLEGGLRNWRSSDNDVFRAVSMDHFTALNINQKVEMLEEICSEERDRCWCKLEVPGIYLGAGATGKP